MLLSRRLRFGFAFNLLKLVDGVQAAIRAPVKHLKSFLEPSGVNYNPQTNTTEEAYDQVAQEWQAHMGENSYDLNTFTYLESTQLSNFGTIDNPNIVFTSDAPYRYICCSGQQNEEDYESHDPMWMMLRQGPLQRCMYCGQVFKLVRLRDERSSEMDYYMLNFNHLPSEDLGQHETLVNFSFSKLNTHYESVYFESPENTVYSLVSGDQHDRILTDPAYRMSRFAETEEKARVYILAMEDYENEKLLNSPFREPLSKKNYTNLIEAEATIKKLDRQFRKITKFNSRKYMDPLNHTRREERMLKRANDRWDGAYTLFTNELTEQEQKYRDYFETDLKNYPQDERIQQFLDRKELLSEPRYRLNKFDFQEGYTFAPQDDQTSYIEKKLFKFKYRRALDTVENYKRRNKRMVAAQAERFKKANTMELITNYVREPAKYEAEYLKSISKESIAQYKDYFQSENDEFNNVLFHLNKNLFSMNFQNWQIEKKDRTTFQTFPLPKWDDKLGFWANAVQIVKEASKVDERISQIQSGAISKAITPSNTRDQTVKQQEELTSQRSSQSKQSKQQLKGSSKEKTKKPKE